MSYSEKNAERILTKVNEKGWNAYDYTDVEANGSGADEAFRKGPKLDLLERDREYKLLPITDEPTDPFLLKLALTDFLTTKGRPSILIEGRKKEWNGFVLGPGLVEVITGSGDNVFYEDFLSALETMTPFP